MNIEFHPNFTKAYKKRIRHNKKLAKQTTDRILLFKKNPQNLLLKNHKLKGSKNNYKSFSITGDIRIVYLEKDENTVIFYDIGTHNQVY